MKKSFVTALFDILFYRLILEGVFLRKPLATCDFPGGPDPKSPSGSAHSGISNKMDIWTLTLFILMFFPKYISMDWSILYIRGHRSKFL